MYYDVIEVRVIGELAFEVRFSDGLSGKVRFLPSYLYGGGSKNRIFLPT